MTINSGIESEYSGLQQPAGVTTILDLAAQLSSLSSEQRTFNNLFIPSKNGACPPLTEDMSPGNSKAPMTLDGVGAKRKSMATRSSSRKGSGSSPAPSTGSKRKRSPSPSTKTLQMGLFLKDGVSHLRDLGSQLQADSARLLEEVNQAREEATKLREELGQVNKQLAEEREHNVAVEEMKAVLVWVRGVNSGLEEKVAELKENMEGALSWSALSTEIQMRRAYSQGKHRGWNLTAVEERMKVEFPEGFNLDMLSRGEVVEESVSSPL